MRVSQVQSQSKGLEQKNHLRRNAAVRLIVMGYLREGIPLAEKENAREHGERQNSLTEHADKHPRKSRRGIELQEEENSLQGANSRKNWQMRSARRADLAPGNDTDAHSRRERERVDKSVGECGALTDEKSIVLLHGKKKKHNCSRTSASIQHQTNWTEVRPRSTHLHRAG